MREGTGVLTGRRTASAIIMSAGLDSLATACSGALSAVAAKVIIYPLDWMKLRLSVKRPDENATSIVTGALKTHGIGGVYMV